MCDVLLVGEAKQVAKWFGGVIQALPQTWKQVDGCNEAQRCLGETQPKVILVGDHVLKRDFQCIVTLAPKARVLVLGTGFNSYRFQALLDWGAEDYWIAPVSAARIERKLAKKRLGIHIEDHGQETEDSVSEMIVGSSKQMIVAMKTAGLVAKTDTSVLIRGESGTGKELLAREVHRLSGRSGDFVALNCAAVSEGVAESELFGHEKGAFTGAVTLRQGCFEQAHGGTLFLDEVGDAPAAFQAKLLRVLEHHAFTRVGGQKPILANVRVVAATNANLEDLIHSGKFRLDLHYRLAGITLNLPPLIARQEDLSEIVGKMVARLNGKLKRSIRGVSRQALEQIFAYPWPGNLRELYQILQRAVLLCRQDVIDVEHLQGMGFPKEAGKSTQVPTLSQVEREHIDWVLGITKGNKGRACDLLGISRPTLRRKLREIRDALGSVPA